MTLLYSLLMSNLYLSLHNNDYLYVLNLTNSNVYLCRLKYTVIQNLNKCLVKIQFLESMLKGQPNFKFTESANFLKVFF